MSKEYIVYNDEYENQIFFCITDGIQDIDEESIEFKKIYLSGLLGSTFGTIDGEESFFVYMTEEINERNIKIYNTFSGPFQEIFMKAAAKIKPKNRRSTLISFWEGNPYGNN